MAIGSRLEASRQVQGRFLYGEACPDGVLGKILKFCFGLLLPIEGEAYFEPAFLVCPSRAQVTRFHPSDVRRPIVRALQHGLEICNLHRDAHARPRPPHAGKAQLFWRLHQRRSHGALLSTFSYATDEFILGIPHRTGDVWQERIVVNVSQI